MSTFPEEIDTFREVEDYPGVVLDPARTDTIYAQDTIDLQEATVAIEETIGVEPTGEYTTMADRLAAMEAQLEGLVTDLITLDAYVATLKLPVGSYYINETDSTNPATLLGYGTWTAVQDYWLVGAGGTYTAGSTYGSLTHAHTLDDDAWAYMYAGSTGVVSTAIAGVPSWNSEYNNAATRSNATTARTNGTPLGGTTNTGSSLPPTKAVYIWKRTA